MTNLTKIFLSVVSIILSVIIFASRIGPIIKYNSINLHVNQLASMQNNICYEKKSQTMQIPAEQFKGNGAVKNSSSVENAHWPESYFKIYGNNTISVTTSLPEGEYQMELLGRHAQPGPIILQVWVNQLPVGLLSFERSDDSWEKKCLNLAPIYWHEHKNDFVISIRFANDGGPKGARDASIGWIRVQ